MIRLFKSLVESFLTWICTILAVFVLFICFAGTSFSQTVECPVDKVCISRDAALKALADSDRVKALEAEIKAKDGAFDAQKVLLNEMRIQFATTSGELTAIKQNAVSDRAIIDLLLKSVKKRCLPFSVCF